MKRLLMLSSVVAGLACISADATVILAGWYDNDGSNTAGQFPEEIHPDVSASLTAVNEFGTGGNGIFGRSSSDGTYGSSGLGSASAPTSPNVNENIWRVTGNASATTWNLAISNTSSSPILLETLHFDIGRPFANYASSVEIAASGDVTVGSLGTTLFPEVLSAYADGFDAVADLLDYDVAISLTDATLDPGESATFLFTFGNANGGTGNNPSQADNIAISGTVIPEPSVLVLMATAGALLTAVSRRRN